jgi:hypothetical protein
MVSASQIREVVAAYLSHNDADKFARDFAALSYNVHKNGDAAAIELARSVEFKIADLRSGCIDKAAFLASLRDSITMSVNSNTRGFAQFSDPVNRPVEVAAGFRGWAVSSGTSPAVVFGSILLVQS